MREQGGGAIVGLLIFQCPAFEKSFFSYCFMSPPAVWDKLQDDHHVPSYLKRSPICCFIYALYLLQVFPGLINKALRKVNGNFGHQRECSSASSCVGKASRVLAQTGALCLVFEASKRGDRSRDRGCSLPVGSLACSFVFFTSQHLLHVPPPSPPFFIPP